MVLAASNDLHILRGPWSPSGHQDQAAALLQVAASGICPLWGSLHLWFQASLIESLRCYERENNTTICIQFLSFKNSTGGFETVDPAAQIPSNQQSLRDDCSTIHATSSEHRDSCQPETYRSTSLGTLVTNKSFVSKPKATSNTESETTWNNQTYFKPIVIITHQDEIRWIHPWYCTWSVFNDLHSTSSDLHLPLNSDYSLIS